MELTKRIQDLFAGGMSDVAKQVSKKIFGNNNETLDFLMDSFYKLSPEQRAGTIVASFLALVLISFGILWFYFSSVSALERELNQSFNALHELRSLKASFESEQGRFNRLLQSVGRKTSAIRMKPFFEEKGQALGVEIQSLTDSVKPLPPDNPLTDKMKYTKVTMTLPKISIPRLLSFVTEVEKSNNFITVEDMVIRGRYGTRLFFDVDVEFRSYSVEGLQP
jgi:hypothetical protein